jgi:hypothetical protein
MPIMRDMGGRLEGCGPGRQASYLIVQGTHIYGEEETGKGQDRRKDHLDDVESNPSKDSSADDAERVQEHKDA